MRLFEIFDSKVEWSWEEDDIYPEAKFEIDNVPYFVVFVETRDITTGEEFIDIEFGIDDKTFNADKIVGTNKKEFLIFSTVFDIIREYLKKEQPDMFKISASKNNENRFPLYQKMTQRSEKVLQSLGYKLYNEKNEGNYSSLIFRKLS